MTAPGQRVLPSGSAEAEDPLVARLARSRTLIRRYLWIRGALPASAMVALLVIALRVGTAAFLPGLGTTVPILVVGLALLLGTLAVAAWVQRTTPTLVELGIRADHVLAAQERISTAVEFLVRGNGLMVSHMTRLLVDDAHGFAANFDPDAIVPAVRPRSWGFLALCLVVVVGVVAAPIGALGPSHTARGANPHLSDGSARVQAQDLKSAAVLVRKDARTLKDPYLEAAAQSLANLGERVAKGTISSTVAAAQVAQLEHLLNLAYQKHGGGIPTSGPQGLPSGQAKTPSASSTGKQVAGVSGAKQNAAPVVSMNAWSSPQSGSSSSVSDFVRKLESGTPAGSPGPSVTDSHAGKAAGQAKGNAHLTAGGQIQNSYYIKDPRQAQIDQMQAMYAAAGQPTGQPVGPAQQSTRGSGDAAGHGSQPLAGDGSTKLPDATRGKSASVTLPSNSSAKGNEIHVDAAPSARRTAVVDVVPGPAVAGAKASETPVLVGMLTDPGMRRTVGRFFLPDNGADSTSPSTSVPSK